MGAVSRSQGQVYPQLEAGELHALWSNELDFEQDSGRIVAISGDKKMFVSRSRPPVAAARATAGAGRAGSSWKPPCRQVYPRAAAA